MTRRTWNRLIPTAAGLAAVVYSLPVLAHEGDHEHLPNAVALRHLLTQPDHLLMLGMLVAVVALSVAGLAWTRARK